MPAIHRPQSGDELAQVVRDALSRAVPLRVQGGDSKRELWSVDPGCDTLDLSALRGVTDYDPEELVITARAGTPLREIEAELAGRRQRLAFDPYDHALLLGGEPGRATLGGVVAANVSGSRRVSAGAARDHVLAFQAVSGRGEPFKCGAAVVKNVTGYDLPKLMAGSWGTLAVLASVTLRVLPRPQAECTVVVRGQAPRAAHESMARCLGMSVAVSAAAHDPADGGTTALRLEGFGRSVAARVEVLAKALSGEGDVGVLHAADSEAWWDRLRSLEALPGRDHVLWRACVPPALGWRVADAVAGLQAHCLHDWGGGLAWVAVPGADPARMLAVQAALAGVAAGLGGQLCLVRASAAARAALRPGARGSSPLQLLQQRVKAAFDPARILNPGCDPGGWA